MAKPLEWIVHSSPEYRSLSDWVVKSVIRAIKNGEIKPGERLVERDLAERFSVSRAPARDAIRKLEVLGIVVQESHKGASVRDWTDADALELVLLVDALILLSVQLAIDRLSEADLQDLESIVEATRELGDAPEIHRRVELELSFHVVIARATGHKRLAAMLEQLQFGLELYAYSVLPRVPIHDSLRLHEELLSVLKRGDTDAAIACVLDHQRESQEVFRQSLAAADNPLA